VTQLQAAGMTGARRIPTIFLTGHAEEDKVNTAAKLGIDGFLVKPVKFAPLTQRSKSVLKRYRKIS